MSEPEFPLAWPQGHPRFGGYRQRGQFGRTRAQAANFLRHELKKMHATDVVISSNVSGLSDRVPNDPGVAVYFSFDGERHVIAVDKWDRVEHNLNAIFKTIEAMRGIERWGTSGMMKRAFGAFKQLSASTARPWWEVLEVKRQVSLADAKAAHRERALTAHPDRGGTHERMAELNGALADAERELAR